MLWEEAQPLAWSEGPGQRDGAEAMPGPGTLLPCLRFEIGLLCLLHGNLYHFTVLLIYSRRIRKIVCIESEREGEHMYALLRMCLILQANADCHREPDQEEVFFQDVSGKREGKPRWLFPLVMSSSLVK